MDRKKLTKRLIYLIFFILVINFLANKFYWYYSVWYLDMIMHFLGGFWLGLLFLYFSSIQKDLNSIVRILLFVLFIGIGWEIYEVLVNDIFARNPFNFLDTISDIFFDLSGGACAILYYFKRIMIQSKDGPWGNSLKDRP